MCAQLVSSLLVYFACAQCCNFDSLSNPPNPISFSSHFLLKRIKLRIRPDFHYVVGLYLVNLILPSRPQGIRKTAIPPIILIIEVLHSLSQTFLVRVTALCARILSRLRKTGLAVSAATVAETPSVRNLWIHHIQNAHSQAQPKSPCWEAQLIPGQRHH